MLHGLGWRGRKPHCETNEMYSLVRCSWRDLADEAIEVELGRLRDDV